MEHNFYHNTGFLAQDVMQRLVSWMQADAHIRAAVLNGSRANPHIRGDWLQDFDLACYVDNLADSPYRRDHSWLEAFGEPAVVQHNLLDAGAFITMVQFTNTLRIDFSVWSVEQITRVWADSLSVVLVDKDERLLGLPPASEASYYVQPPAVEAWDTCLNEIAWLAPYVARALWRAEMPRALDILHAYLIPQVRQVLSWQAAQPRGWQVNLGASGRWLGRYLDPQLYSAFLALYVPADEAAIWQAVDQVLRLTESSAVRLADALGSGYCFPFQDWERVRLFIAQIKAEPRINS
jgi:aminoglycoside 6-adenylyltransferase